LKSRTSKEFRNLLAKLPADVQRAADSSYTLFQGNPSHPSLHFKPLQGLSDVYSVRISLGYRALGRVAGGGIVWFWIGSHADYDRIVAGK